MIAGEKIPEILEDVTVHVKLKISALWVAMMFLYIYADYQTLLQPGISEQIIAGEVEGVRFTRAVLLGGAILIAIPSIMIFLSLVLKPRVNRWANIILGIVYTVVNIADLISFEQPWAYIIFYKCVEIVLTLLIAWYAWSWPGQEV